MIFVFCRNRIDRDGSKLDGADLISKYASSSTSDCDWGWKPEIRCSNTSFINSGCHYHYPFHGHSHDCILFVTLLAPILTVFKPVSPGVRANMAKVVESVQTEVHRRAEATKGWI